MPDAEVRLEQVDGNALGIRDEAVVRLASGEETWVDLTTSIRTHEDATAPEIARMIMAFESWGE